MLDDSQTQQGADTLTVDPLKPKQKTRIACWNVRTLYQTGKLAQVVKEFHRYRLASGHTILYSGRLEDQHVEGVALIMSRKIENTLIEWKPSGPSQNKARFNLNYTKLAVIVCYAPTEDEEEADKDSFYDQVQAIIEDVPAHDMLMVVGDLNARPGNNNSDRERVGKHGIGNVKENGERLCNFCEENNMVIGSTLFQHKDIHKMTWTSPS